MAQLKCLTPHEAIYVGTVKSILYCVDPPDRLRQAVIMGMDINVLQDLKDSNHMFRNILSALHTACIRGHYHVVRWLLRAFPSHIPRIDHLNNILIDTCSKGHLAIVQFLIHTFPCLKNYECNYFEIFFRACYNNQVHIAQWLLSMRVEHQPFFFTQLLINACHNGYIRIIQMIIKICHPVDSWLYEKAFYVACQNGYLNVAQWLYIHCLKNQEYRVNDELLPDVCCKGYLHMAQWLVRTFTPNIDPCAQNNAAFRWSCEYGHLQVAQWLVWRFPDIDHRAYDDCAFIQACLNGHFRVVRWLVDTYPNTITYRMCNVAFDAMSKEYDGLHKVYQTRIKLVIRWLVRMYPELKSHPFYSTIVW